MRSPNSVRAGKAHVELGLDKSQFQQALKTIGNDLKMAGAKLKLGGAALTGFGVAILAPLTQAVSLASDFQEISSKFDTVFGELSSATREWGEDFAKTIGRSKVDVLGFLASTQDLLVPLGVDPKEAVELSKRITQLTIDLASFNNLAESDVLRDLQAALTGSGEVMKEYGVIVSEAAVKQQLLNRGLDPKNVAESGKALARWEIILAGTTAAQGDAERTAGSFANVMRKLKSLLKDTATEIGLHLLPLATDLARSVSAAVKPIAEFAKRNRELTVALAKVGLTAIVAGPALFAFGAAITAAGGAMRIFSSAAAVLPLLATPIGAVTAAFVGITAAIFHAVVGVENLKLAITDFGGFAALTVGRFEQLFIDSIAEIMKSLVDLRALIDRDFLGARFTKIGIDVAAGVKKRQIDERIKQAGGGNAGHPADLPGGEFLAPIFAPGGGAVADAITRAILDANQQAASSAASRESFITSSALEASFGLKGQSVEDLTREQTRLLQDQLVEQRKLVNLLED